MANWGYPLVKRIPMIKSDMTPFPYSIDIHAPLTRARDLVVEHGIRYLPVTEDSEPVGVLVDAQINQALDPRFSNPSVPELCVEDAHILPSHIVELSEPLDNVLIHMASNHLDCALVVKQGKLVGIFTVYDVCKSYGETLRAQFSVATTDNGDDAA